MYVEIKDVPVFVDFTYSSMEESAKYFRGRRATQCALRLDVKSFLESKGISENQIERVEDDDLISVGIAQCSAGDNFRKAVGRYMALRRAIPDMICFFKNNMKIDLNNQDINKFIHDIGCDCYLKKE